MTLKYTILIIGQMSILSLTLQNETVKSYSHHLLPFRISCILHTWTADGLLQGNSIAEKDGQCMYNAPLRCNHVITAAVGT